MQTTPCSIFPLSKSWFSSNFLIYNCDKTKFLHIGTKSIVSKSDSSPVLSTLSFPLPSDLVWCYHWWYHFSPTSIHHQRTASSHPDPPLPLILLLYVSTVLLPPVSTAVLFFLVFHKNNLINLNWFRTYQSPVLQPHHLYSSKASMVTSQTLHWFQKCSVHISSSSPWPVYHTRSI